MKSVFLVVDSMVQRLLFVLSRRVSARILPRLSLRDRLWCQDEGNQPGLCSWEVILSRSHCFGLQFVVYYGEASETCHNESRY